MFVLRNADLSLWSDPVNTRVALPHLQVLSPTAAPQVATVRFDGYRDPHAYRGEGLLRTFHMEVLFGVREHAAALALEDLLVEAATVAVDGRLQLRTHTGQVAGLDEVEVIVVTGWSHTPQRGLSRVVSVDAIRVHAPAGV